MKKNITTVVSVAFVGGMIGRGFRYLLNVVIARGLGAEALGTFAFGMVLLKFLSVFSRLGFDNAALKYIPRYRTEGNDNYILGLSIVGLGFPLVTGGVLAVGLTVVAPSFSGFFDQRLLDTLPLFAVGIPLFSAMFVGMAITRGYNESKYAVYTRDIGQSVVAIVLVAAGAFLLDDFDMVVLGYVASMVVGLVLVVGFLYHQEALRFDIRPHFEFREWFVFSVPMVAIAVSTFLIGWTDILMLGIFVPAEALGWYQAAYQTSVLLLVVLQSSTSIFPSLASDLYKRGDYQRLESTYIAVTKWIVYLTSLGGSFILLYREEILRLFGETAPEAETTLVILAAGQFVAASVGAPSYLLSMSGNERLEFANTLAILSMNIILNYILIRRYGIVGAGLATSVSLTILHLIRLTEVYWILGIHPYHQAYWRGGVGIISGFSILYLGQNLPLPPSIRAITAGFIALLGFAAVMNILGFDKYDRLLIESLE